MHTIEFTSDSYNFLNNSSTLHDTSMFNITLDVFIIFKVYLSLIEYIFWYHMLLNALCLHLLHNSALVCDSCTYTMTYNVYHLHLVYIWDIYLSMNCYWLIHIQPAAVVMPKTILQWTTDICHDIGACNILCNILLVYSNLHG